VISFDLFLKGIDFFEIETGRNQELIKQLSGMEGLAFKLTCSSPRNSYQKDSSLDSDIKKYLLDNGNKLINPNFPQCPINIAYDFALRIGDKNVVFEIEKANKEKILYDYLKAHIYMDYGIDNVVIIAPKNWVHAHGTYDLFKVAKERISLCYQYQMGNEKKLKKILIVGFTQIYNNQIHSNTTLAKINQKCKLYFQT
jgi:hypothetical protein